MSAFPGPGVLKVEQVPQGLLAYEHQNSRLHERGSHWLQAQCCARMQLWTSAHGPCVRPPMHRVRHDKAPAHGYPAAL